MGRGRIGRPHTKDRETAGAPTVRFQPQDLRRRAAHRRTRPRVVLHSVAAREGTRLARWLDQATASFGDLRPLIGPFSRPIVRLSGPDELIEDASQSLPEGAARPEAVAVRLRRCGVELSWGAADRVLNTPAFRRLCHDRGVSSVELVRADPSLLTEMQIGAFFHAYWRRRVLRHAAIRLGLAAALARVPGVSVGLASDLAFWRGVRSVATVQEWERWTRSSYVVFYYHRIGVDGWPGQEHLDLHAQRFARQLRLLRLLGFHPISLDELVAFHRDPTAALPGRAYVLTADDALRDAVATLGRHAQLHPHVFVNTSAAGTTPPWAFGKPVADWHELNEFVASGGVVGSHCRGHPRLPWLDRDALREELEGSLRDLREHVPRASPVLAYPHGLHDERVRSAAIAAGFSAAFTTEPGRNGVGTDVYCLRRVGIKDWDGYAALLWKTVTGELLPRRWEQLRMSRRRRNRDLERREDTL